MSAFDAAFKRLIGHEGGYTTNPADPGNWTGGAPGHGVCAGTCFGISAAAYPTLDIKGITLDAAKAIYKRDYWDRIAGDRLPPAVAFVVFDAAVNNGIGRAVRLLQASLDLRQDGVIGPATLAAVAKQPPMVLAVEFVAQRAWFMSRLPTWPTFGLGWSRRLTALPAEALELARDLERPPSTLAT